MHMLVNHITFAALKMNVVLEFLQFIFQSLCFLQWRNRVDSSARL